MGVTEILPRKTYNIKDFFSRQHTLIEDFGHNFGDFRNLVCQVCQGFLFVSYEASQLFPNPTHVFGCMPVFFKHIEMYQYILKAHFWMVPRYIQIVVKGCWQHA
jgi:hypothetical protein